MDCVVNVDMSWTRDYIQLSLEEKGQYVTITFTTTYNYLVFATKLQTIVTSC
jgi:hypothetical protein